MKITIGKEIDTQLWKDLINTSSTASFFQTQECYNFYSTLSFMESFAIGVSEKGKLTGLVCGYILGGGNPLKRFFSRRAIIPGGALLAENISYEALQILFFELKKQIGKKAIYIEFRNCNDYSNYRKAFEEAGFEYQPHLNFHVETPSVEIALKNLSSTKRRHIKLSLKEDAIISEAKSLSEINEFYLLLKELYKTKVKTPLFPLEFFEKVITLPHGKILIIKYKNRVIGGSVCVCLEKKVLYEWFVCGEDGKYKNVYPSTLATWAYIEYAANNECLYFDMMGAGKPDEGYGVREFKSKFGGKLLQHGRFLYIARPLLYKIGKKIIELIKKEKKK